MRVSQCRGRLEFGLLSLWLAIFPIFGGAVAQTISADRVDIVQGRDNWSVISWSYPKTNVSDDMDWGLCFKAVTSRQLDNLQTAGLSESCVETNYFDAKSGHGEYDARLYLPLGAENQSFVAAVVNRKDGYSRPYAHVVLTISHAEYTYDDNLITLPEGRRCVVTSCAAIR